MQKLKLNRRGVSPIIATLLLVAIAVAAAIVTYTWTMSLATNQSQQAQTGIKLDSVYFGKNTTDNTYGIYVSIRNTGSVAATIEAIHLVKGSQIIISESVSGMTVPQGDVLNAGFTNATTWTATIGFKSGGLALPIPETTETVTIRTDLVVNTAYTLKLVTSTGFVVEGTYYTPGEW